MGLLVMFQPNILSSFRPIYGSHEGHTVPICEYEKRRADAVYRPILQKTPGHFRKAGQVNE